jgi:hypothetical protein
MIIESCRARRYDQSDYERFGVLSRRRGARPASRNLFAAETAASVRHHVALSIVGTDRMPDNGYFRAKVAQEKLVEASGIPYTISARPSFWNSAAPSPPSVRMETSSGFRPACSSPSRADDVAPVVAEVALAPPRSGIVEIAGPERAPFNEIVARYLKAVGDPRAVVRDPEARYWGGRSRSARSCRWATPASAVSVSTNGSAARRQKPDPASVSRRIGLHETHPPFAACRHPAVQQRPRVYAEGEERQGDPRLPARAAGRSRQERQGCARRIRPGGYSPGHTHPKSAFIYATVLWGAIGSRVNDGPVTTYKAGESSSELATATPSAPMPARRNATIAVLTDAGV